MTKPSSETQFQFAVKDLESKKWDFMGFKKDLKGWFIEWFVVNDKQRLVLYFELEDSSYVPCDLATILCSLSARKLWFGEEKFVYCSPSQIMFSQGEPVQMLDYVVKFLKGSK